MIFRTVCAALFSFLLPFSVLAAPFCIESQALPPQCMYYDAASCQREATRQQAACSVNVKELPLSNNVGQYCMVRALPPPRARTACAPMLPPSHRPQLLIPMRHSVAAAEG
jgi:hypothetical protein